MELEAALIPLKNVIDIETRLVLVGRTGEGKTSTANSIIGRRHFTVKASAKSVTKKCSYVEENVLGRPILLVDTPGLFDTTDINQTTLLEISKCLMVSAPGPHAFLMVLTTQRFTEEIQESVQLLRQSFGEHVLTYTIIIFTRKDDLEHEGTTIKEFLGDDIPDYMQKLLEACGGRYIAFNNRLSGVKNEEQVQTLLSLVESLVAQNGGKCYSSEQFKQVEATIQQEEKRRKDKIEKDTQRAIAPFIKQKKESDEKQAKLEKEKAVIEKRTREAEEGLKKLKMEMIKREQEEKERRRLEAERLREEKLQREKAEREKRIAEEQAKQKAADAELEKNKRREEEQRRKQAEEQSLREKRQRETAERQTRIANEKREYAERKQREDEAKLEQLRQADKENERRRNEAKREKYEADQKIKQERRRAQEQQNNVRSGIRKDTFFVRALAGGSRGAAIGSGIAGPAGAVVGAVVGFIGGFFGF